MSGDKLWEESTWVQRRDIVVAVAAMFENAPEPSEPPDPFVKVSKRLCGYYKQLDDERIRLAARVKELEMSSPEELEMSSPEERSFFHDDVRVVIIAHKNGTQIDKALQEFMRGECDVLVESYDDVRVKVLVPRRDLAKILPWLKENGYKQI